MFTGKNRFNRSSLLSRALLVGLCVALTAGSAIAQSDAAKKKKEKEVLTPPTPTQGGGSAPYFPMGCAIIIFGMVVGVNFLPSKRGHQD